MARVDRELRRAAPVAILDTVASTRCTRARASAGRCCRSCSSTCRAAMARRDKAALRNLELLAFFVHRLGLDRLPSSSA
jgi:hypothetical protein